MIITIDGPAGAGKSTAAKLLAQRLGFEFLDTGAMYRAVTLAALRAQINFDDEESLTRLLDGMKLDLTAARVLLDGEDVTGSIRTPQITELSAPIASSPVVRRRLVEWQRQIALDRNMVCEGRDQGTIAFPHAECKFFLKADPIERARRRLRDLQSHGETTTLEEVLAAQQARDARDAARHIAPMTPAADALILDSTSWTIDEMVTQMERTARARMS